MSGREAIGAEGVSELGHPARLRSGQTETRVDPSKARTGFFKRRGGLLCQGCVARYTVLASYRHLYPIRMMCRFLHVSSGGYYARQPGQRAVR